MLRASAKLSSLPKIGEQVMIRPRKGERDFTILGTISKSTFNAFECAICARDIQDRLPSLIDQRTGIASMLKAAPKEEIEVSYKRHGGVYRFFTNASAKIKGDSAILVMDIPDSVRKSQRRRDYRLPLAARVSIKTTAPSQRVTGSLVNLSATGAMVISPVILKTGQTLEMSVESDGASGQIDLIDAVVVECISQIDERSPAKTNHTLRLAFDDRKTVRLADWQKEQIAHFIFEQQRQMLKLRSLMG